MALTDNLVAYWKLDGNLNDSVGSNNGTGNITPQYATGKINNGFTASANNYATLTNLPFYGSPTTGTYNFWFKCASSSRMEFISGGDNGNGHLFDIATYAIAGGGVQLYCSYNSASGGAGAVYATGDAGDGNWHMCTVVFNGAGAIQLYKDGIINQTTWYGGTSGINIDNAASKYFGCDTANGHKLNGVLDEVGAWSRALTAGEVQQLYNAGRALAYPLTVTVDNGLMSYYKFEGNSNDSVASVNGTDTSITYNLVNGKIGQGAGFGGSSLINFGNNFNFTTQSFSVAGWFKIPNASSYRMIIGKTASDANPDWGLRLNQTTGYLEFLIYGAGSTVDDAITTGTNYADNAWHHVAALRNGTNVKIYVDGIQKASVTDNLRNCSNSHNCKMGIDDGGNFQVPNGTCFDEWGIWQRGLTQDDILKLYNAGRGNQYAFTDNLLTALVSYYKLDGVSCDTMSSYNGLDTAITYNSTYGKVNQGASFNGSSSKINLGDYNKFSFLNGIFSFSAWIKCGTQNNYAHILGKGTASNYEYYFGFDNANHLQLQCWDNAGNSIMYAVGSTALNDNTWHHIVAVSDGTNGKVYVDGSDNTSSSASFSGTMTNGAAELMIGCRNTTLFYTGYIDEVGIWNRTLSTAEITSLYNSGSGNQWPFGLLSGIVFDNSATTYAGTGGSANTWSHPCYGSNRVLIVGFMCPPDSGSYTGNSCTYNGVSMTEVAHVNVSNGTTDWWISLWYLLNPATGSNTVSFSGSNAYAGASISYTGVKQSGFPDSYATSNSLGSSVTTFTQSTTVVASNCILLEVFRNMGGGSYSDNGYTFLRRAAGTGTDAITLYDSYGTVGTGSQSLTTSFSSSKAGAVIISIAPYVAVTTSTSSLLSLMGVG